MKIYSEMTDDEVRAEYLAAIQGWEDAVNYDSFGGADLKGSLQSHDSRRANV